MRQQWCPVFDLFHTAFPPGDVKLFNQSQELLASSNAAVSTLYRQLWTRHWTPALSTFSTMSPIWRTLSASPVSWWPLHFSARLQSSELAGSYYCSLIRLQKKTTNSWDTVCCKLNPTALFSLRSVDWKAIFHYCQKWAKVRLSFCAPLSVRYQTTMWAEVLWSPFFSCCWPDTAASFSWLFSLGACWVRFAHGTQPLSIGYPKTLLGSQSDRICESLIRQAKHMVRTW